MTRAPSHYYGRGGFAFGKSRRCRRCGVECVHERCDRARGWFWRLPGGTWGDTKPACVPTEDAALRLACDRLATETEEQAKNVEDEALWPEMPHKAQFVRAYLRMLAMDLRARRQP